VDTSTAFDDRYEIRRFAPGLDAGGAADAATSAFWDSMGRGFHETMAPARMLRTVPHLVADGLEQLGVYRRDPFPGSIDETEPIGTFGSLRKELSWGDGTGIDTFAVIGVTVRPTERRRGVLRRMMTDSLRRAAAEGYAVASLTASEGSIYRRFGFGPGIRERTIDIRAERAVPFLTPTTGEVAVVDTATLADGVARQVFDRFHARTPGSMVRNSGVWGRLLGREDDAGAVDPAVRGAAHRPSRSEPIDGYVTYRIVDAETPAQRLDVVDLVAATDEAYLALWEYLLSVDLNDVVRYPLARIDDPIVAAIRDNRAMSIVREEDHVWYRVLDVAATLESRPWAVDGTLTIALVDNLGFADGVFRLTVREGRGSVERIGDRPASGADERGPAADLAMDVAELGSLLLGAVDPRTLAAAGLVQAAEETAPALLHAMLTPVRTPHGITYF